MLTLNPPRNKTDYCILNYDTNLTYSAIFVTFNFARIWPTVFALHSHIFSNKLRFHILSWRIILHSFRCRKTRAVHRHQIQTSNISLNFMIVWICASLYNFHRFLSKTIRDGSLTDADGFSVIIGNIWSVELMSLWRFKITSRILVSYIHEWAEMQNTVNMFCNGQYETVPPTLVHTGHITNLC